MNKNEFRTRFITSVIFAGVIMVLVMSSGCNRSSEQTDKKAVTDVHNRFMGKPKPVDPEELCKAKKAFGEKCD